MYLKVLSPSNQKDFNMFTLWDIQPNEITTLEELKEEVFMQYVEKMPTYHGCWSLEWDIFPLAETLD